MKTHFLNADGAVIITDMIEAINENKQYLSDIDGLIGDGDHGINMNKGFQLCKEQLKAKPGDLAYSALALSKILMMKIGGSMGPLYGKLYKGFAKTLEGKELIGMGEMRDALNAMLASIQSISPAVVGDKTLMDALVPAVNAFNFSVIESVSFVEALDAMAAAAEVGRDSTKELVAKLGRASRLGDRSIGVMDAGATSCCLLLQTLATSCKKLLA